MAESQDKLRCAECPVPVAEMDGDELVIRVRHYGEKHETRIPVSELTKGSVPLKM